ARAIAQHVRWLRDEHFDHLDGRATARVLELVAAHAGVSLLVPATTDPPVPRPVVTAVDFHPGEEPRLVVTIHPRDGRGPVRRGGARARVDGVSARTGDGLVAVTFPLVVTRWGTAGLALPSGDYRLTLAGEPPTTRFAVSATQLPDVRTLLFNAA